GRRSAARARGMARAERLGGGVTPLSLRRAYAGVRDSLSEQLRLAEQLAALVIEHAQADQHSGLGEELAVVKRDFADVREGAARVEVEPAGGGSPGHDGGEFLGPQLDGVAVFGHQARVRVDARLLRGAGG